MMTIRVRKGIIRVRTVAIRSLVVATTAPNRQTVAITIGGFSAAVRLHVPSVSLMLRKALRLLLSYNGTRATSNMDDSAALCRQRLAAAAQAPGVVRDAVVSVFRTGCQKTNLLQSHFCAYFLHAQHAGNGGKRPPCITDSWLRQWG